MEIISVSHRLHNIHNIRSSTVDTGSTPVSWIVYDSQSHGRTGHRLITSPQFPAAGGLSQTQQCGHSAGYRPVAAAFPMLCGENSSEAAMFAFLLKWSEGIKIGVCSALTLRPRLCSQPVFEVQSAILPNSPLSGVAVVIGRIPVSGSWKSETR